MAESVLVAFRGLSSTSDRISCLVELLSELRPDERLAWQASAHSFFHRDFVGFLPPELACKVLDLLDAPTLLRCCQVSTRWLQRMRTNHLLWVRLARSQGARIPESPGRLEDADAMRALVVRSLRQRRSLRSGAAFRMRKILEENPNFTVTDCCGDLLAAANVHDAHAGNGVVALYDLAADREILRLRQSPEFGFPCAIKLFSRQFACVGYVSGRVACYRLRWNRADGVPAPSPAEPELMLPTPQGSIYCVGGCTTSNVLICGSSDCRAYIWDLEAPNKKQFLAAVQNPPDEAVVSANVGESAIVTMSKCFIRVYRYDGDEKSGIASAAKSPPWRKIRTSHEAAGQPAGGVDAFFTPGVHLRGGSVTFVRQRLLFEAATVGNADIVTVDCASGDEVSTTHVNQKIRKLLAVGRRFALALLPFFDASHKNLIVVDLHEKRVVGGCTVPHSKSTTPDISQIALGDLAWLDGLGGAGDSRAGPSLLVGLPVINHSHVLLVNVFRA